MPITVGQRAAVGAPPDTVHIAAPRGKRTVEAVLGENDAWEVLRVGRRPRDRWTRRLAARRPAAIVSTAAPSSTRSRPVGPLNDSTYVLPGAIRVRASDLKAIAPNLRPGVAVYFY